MIDPLHVSIDKIFSTQFQLKIRLRYEPCLHSSFHRFAAFQNIQYFPAILRFQWLLLSILRQSYRSISGIYNTHILEIGATQQKNRIIVLQRLLPSLPILSALARFPFGTCSKDTASRSPFPDSTGMRRSSGA